MTNDQFDNMVAQIAHASAAYAVTVTFYVFGISMIYPILSIVAFAALKEFWYDIKYESPEESGGVPGSIKDFIFYLLGLTLALLVVITRHYS
jgi:hypothetical protein